MSLDGCKDDTKMTVNGDAVVVVAMTGNVLLFCIFIFYVLLLQGSESNYERRIIIMSASEKIISKLESHLHPFFGFLLAFRSFPIFDISQSRKRKPDTPLLSPPHEYFPGVRKHHWQLTRNDKKKSETSLSFLQKPSGFTIARDVNARDVNLKPASTDY